MKKQPPKAQDWITAALSELLTPGYMFKAMQICTAFRFLGLEFVPRECVFLFSWIFLVIGLKEARHVHDTANISIAQLVMHLYDALFFSCVMLVIATIWSLKCCCAVILIWVVIWHKNYRLGTLH